MNKQFFLRIAKYLGIGFLTIFLTIVLIGGSIFLFYVVQAPELSETKLVATTSSKIYDSKNDLIADLMLKAMKSLQIWLMRLYL